MKAALYARVSTEEQAKEGTSIDFQLEKLNGYAQVHDWQVIPGYIDAGFSGKTDDRPEFQRLMRDVQTGRLDVVAVWKLDRFFRKLRLLLEYKEKLDKAGAAFVSISEGIDTSSVMGRLLFNLLGSIAEWEREEIVNRTREGRHSRYREGKWASGQPLYGYRYNPATKKLETREDEARIVRRIYNLYIYDRLGFVQLGRLLNKEGISRRQQASRWHSSAVRDIIDHHGYKGEHPLGVECPAIITPTLWEMAQKRRKDNTRLHRREGSPWLLQAMIKCGLCGHLLKAEWSHGVNGKRVYSCYGRRQDTFPDNRHKCSLPRIPAEWLEEQVWQRITDALSNPESLSKALNDYIAKLESRRVELEVTIMPVDDRLADINERLGRLAEAWVAKEMRPDKLLKMKEELEAERERLQSVRAEIDPRQVEELEDTKRWLGFWNRTSVNLHKGLQYVLEGETPEEKAIEEAEKRGLVRSDFQAVVQLATIDNPGLSKQVGSPTTRRQLLDYLQVEIWAYLNRVEVKGIIPIEPIPQECNSVCRSGRCPLSR